ncbi:hypothetical protein F5B17DRAFT_400679 [Nemania serpens]|nr:hypothetical protein F5B17DRAFT_400679 [Nemania serpens]
MDVFTSLPSDVFLLIISYLSPAESILCRRVSRSWNAVFTSDEISWNLMRWHFPRVREMRNPAGALDRSAYAHIFPKVARRYFHLRSARPRLVERIDTDAGVGQGSFFYEVEPWNRHLRWNSATSPFQYRDASWCLDEGLLVYWASEAYGYIAYDLETGDRIPVPFDGVGRIVRRVRLAHSTLLIEWCEAELHYRSDSEKAIHRHFATAFDVQRSTKSGLSDDPGPWGIRFRSEWKLHRLGLPLNRQDRFFSAHTATHYVVYVWKQNGAPHDGEEPVEELTIWEIKDTSAYRPSEDPAGAEMPGTAQPQPRVARAFAGHELDVLGIRQGRTPMLREILLDEANMYFHEEKHGWLAGYHTSSPPPRHHSVRSTGIPLSGIIGPRWFDECCADNDGHNIHLGFCPRAGSAVRISDGDGAPDRFDGSWPGYAPCWRHEEFPYLTVSSVVDARAGVRIAARRCSMIEAVSSFVRPKISLRTEADEAHEVRFADDMWKQLLGKGKIAGDERWVVGEDGDGSITIVRF